jgi:hypothetical protein
MAIFGEAKELSGEKDNETTMKKMNVMNPAILS